MLPETLEELLTPEQAKELAWMVKKAEKPARVNEK